MGRVIQEWTEVGRNRQEWTGVERSGQERNKLYHLSPSTTVLYLLLTLWELELGYIPGLTYFIDSHKRYL